MTITASTPGLTTPLVAPAVLEDVSTVVSTVQRSVTPAPVRVPWALLAVDLLAATAVVVPVRLVTGAWPLPLVVAVPVLWLALVVSTGGYRDVPGARRVVRAASLARAAAVLGLAFWVTSAISPGLLGTSATTSRAGLALVLLLPLASMGSRRFLGSAATAGRTSRIVLAGDHQGVDDLLRELRRAAAQGRTTFEPVGVCLSADDDLPSTLGELQVWRGLEFVADAVLAHAAQAVVVVPGPELDHHALRRLNGRLQETGTGMFVSAGLRDVDAGRLELTTAGGIRALQVRPAPLRGPSRAVKDVADRVAAAVLLTLLAPLLAVLVVVIRLGSPGPAVFRQVRVGRHGEQFTLWKLRTMTIGAEDVVAELSDANEYDAEGVLFKIRHDPRLTRAGRVLRKFSLDELPQLVNVVRGEMSLVGPRPALPAEVRAYDEDVRRRLDVKPGMTGLWQVSGRSDLPWEETVRLDLSYVDNWSWSLDGSIMLRTVHAVVGHRGAY